MPARPDASPARALACLYSPASLRPLLAALCALEQEVGASLRPGLDHQVAHARLAWWREECVRCAQGRPAHPLTRELCARLTPAAAGALAGLAGLVDTATWDLAGATFETQRELSAYCERWSSALLEPLARHAAPAVSPAQVRALGRNLRELELLLAVAGDARAGRVRLPLDELERAGAAVEELAQPPWSAALASLVRARHRERRSALASAVDALAPSAQAPLRGVIVWAALICRDSVRAEARLPRATRASETHRLLDGWRAWRAARRADAGRGMARGWSTPPAPS